MTKEEVKIKQEKGTESTNGKLTYEDKVIQKIVGIALENIDGLLTIDGGFFSNLTEKLVNTDNMTSGVNVEVGEKQVAVDLDIVAEFGKDLNKIFDEMKAVISKEVKQMTGLEVIEVNVNVVDIKTVDQHKEDSVSLQDKMSDVTDTVGDFASEQAEKAKGLVAKGSNKANESIKSRVQ